MKNVTATVVIRTPSLQFSMNCILVELKLRINRGEAVAILLNFKRCLGSLSSLQYILYSNLVQQFTPKLFSKTFLQF